MSRRLLRTNHRCRVVPRRVVAPILIEGCLVWLSTAALAQHTTTRTYDYDANGALVSRSDGVRTDRFVSDVRCKLIGAAVQSTASLSQYRYDADGERVAVGTTGEAVNQLVDSQNNTGYSQVIEQHQRSSAQPVAYTFGNERLSLNALVSHRCYHSDGQHSIRNLTSPTGDSTDSYRFDAFGNTLATAGDSPNEFRFAGEQHDTTTDLYYLRARNYAPLIGRFASTDPILGHRFDPHAIHLYAYARNDPMLFRDPSGELTMLELVITVGTVGILAAAGSLVALQDVADDPEAHRDELEAATRRAKDALEAYVNNDLPHFREWFGTDDAQQRAHIREQLGAMIDLLNSGPHFAKGQRLPCATSADRLGYAYVYAGSSTIHICNPFYNVLTPTMQAGTLVHEAHHATSLLSVDFARGEGMSWVLARYYPWLAIHNADNYRYAVGLP